MSQQNVLFPDAFSRNFIGVNHLRQMADRVSEMSPTNFPPYNMEQLNENSYVITLALAGYNPDDLDIQVEENILTIEARTASDWSQRDNNAMLHRGISFRAFSRRFVLGEYVEVTSADMKNGLLEIKLERIVPEAKKPKKIEIARRALTDESR